MAAPHSVDPAQLVEQLASASPDVLREMVTTMANALMSAQADQLCGAEYGERSPQRANRRNGYRARDWDTRAGRSWMRSCVWCGQAVHGVNYLRISRHGRACMGTSTSGNRLA